MADKNETVADIKSEMYGIVADEFGYVKLAQSDFIGIADRFEAAHEREMEVLRRRLDAVFESRKTTCGLCPSSEKIKELERRLKVAEDALKPWPSLAEWLVENSTKLGISDMVSKLRERSEEAKNAIAAISGEGVK